MICGVGDYATLVGSRLEQLRPELRCGYIACGSQREPRPSDATGLRNITGTCDARCLWRAVGELADELNSDADALTLVMHYSGYGYEPSGAPAWLAGGLEQRPRRFTEAKIVTMFHELYATGWPWQRIFWTSSRQRAVAVRIARASDALLTNREQSARWLERVTGGVGGVVPSLPVPSTIGEADEIVPWEARGARAVMFGGAQFKRPFLQGRGAKNTAALCRKLEIRTLVGIGQPAEADQAAFRASGIEVVQTGFVAANEASAYIGAARVALVDYFSGYYAKSTVLAAMAAHGTPVIFPRSGNASDGLRFGEHIWDLPATRAASPHEARARLSSLSLVLRAWYEGHGIERHAGAVARCADSANVAIT